MSELIDLVTFLSLLPVVFGMIVCCCASACACGQCTGATKRYVQFVIAGMANNLCSNCDDYNGTFEAEQIPDDAGTFDDCCHYLYTFPSPPCTTIDLLSFRYSGLSRAGAISNCMVATQFTCAAGWVGWQVNYSFIDQDCDTPYPASAPTISSSSQCSAGSLTLEAIPHD